MSDPDARPHGGESLRGFAARVGRWLDGQAQLERGAVVVTHAGVIKAALVHALRMPVEAFWRIDAAPLAITELHARDGPLDGDARQLCGVPMRWNDRRRLVPRADRGRSSRSATVPGTLFSPTQQCVLG